MAFKASASGGFTLVEAMIGVAVAAILVGVALPSFFDTLRRSRRADAYDLAVGVLQAQELWRGANPLYADNLSALNQPTTSGAGYYRGALSAATGAGYTFTASAVSGKGQDRDTGCATLTVTVANGVPAYTPADCWNR